MLFNLKQYRQALYPLWLLRKWRQRPTDHQKPLRVIFYITLLLTAVWLLRGCNEPAWSAEIGINLGTIAEIESGGHPDAFNRHSGAIGEYQILPIVLKDYNKHALINHLTPLSVYDMYNPKLALMVSSWYLNTKIPDMLWDYDIPDTITSRLIAYNWGIGHLNKWFKHGSHWNQLPKETRNYIKKYFRLEHGGGEK